MFVMTRKYNGCSNAKETNRIIENVVQGITALPGFHSYGVVDLGDGQVATMSLFDTREQAMHSADVARGLIQDKDNHLAALLPNPPEITMGEVLSLHRK